jgi:hypothetical protein
MRSFWLKEKEEKGKNVWSLLEMSENVSKEGRTSGLSLEMKLFSSYSFNIHVKKIQKETLFFFLRGKKKTKQNKIVWENV